MTTVERPKETTADAEEIARFAAMADAWWDMNGKFAPLHKFNPVRVAFIRERISAHFGRQAANKTPLQGLNVLDIGSGGGLLSEPIHRLGATVLGIDAAEKNVAVARLHADQQGLNIDYRTALPEDLAGEGASFDVVLNMEVVEHVADVGMFLDVCGRLVRPGGAMVIATLNRTLKSLAMAKVGAEYVLRWLPTGTHDWRRFVKPSELAAGLRPHGLTVRDLRGVSYNALRDTWALSDDVSVNYLVFAAKARSSGTD
jgi:2-polyprenyl-6-hydroxyphenyl methylase / 3-demethylubiquinone-9 3-methyltransferase